MAGHTSEKRWNRNQTATSGIGISDQTEAMATSMVGTLLAAEQLYLEMLELYQYVGSTEQGLADQLFYEYWSARSVDAVQAVLTVDVVGGAVENPTITTAGTGYFDGTGFTFLLSSTADGGDGFAEITYDVVSGAVTNASVSVAGTTYTNGTDVTVLETPAPTEATFETEANAEELTKATDLIAAITASHEIYGAANNVVTSQEDRLAQLRRMSV